MNHRSVPPDTFHTDRIFGRKPTLEDAQGIFDVYATDPEVTRYLVFKPYSSIEQLRTWLVYIIKEWEKKPGIMYLLFKKDSPTELVGSFSIGVDGHKAEVGYLIAQPYWRQGLMTEILRHWVVWSLAQPGIYRIGALCDVDNPASGKVMLKAGMEFEGTLKRWSIHPNISDEPRDALIYSKSK